MTAEDTVPGGDRLRVLLVEDNEAAGKGLARLLEAQGYVVTRVQNGESALAALGDGNSFDHLLTDLQLPDVDGLQVAREARRLAPHLRVVLITGWDVACGGASAAARCVDRVLTKPVDVGELVAILKG